MVGGTARGHILLSHTPVSFSLVDPLTGAIGEHGHPLCGMSLSGRVLVFPRASGSSSGSYVLLHLATARTAPAALVAVHADAITAAGAVLGRIPLVHRLVSNPLVAFADGELVEVDGMAGSITSLGIGDWQCT